MPKGKSKGINIVSWDFSTAAPKMAQAKTLAFSGFTAPRVPAGKYKIVLTKGKETYTHNIEVKYDEKSVTTLEQRKEQETLTDELFNMVEDLAFMKSPKHKQKLLKLLRIIQKERKKPKNYLMLWKSFGKTWLLPQAIITLLPLNRNCEKRWAIFTAMWLQILIRFLELQKQITN